MKEEMERIWDVMDRDFLDEETIQKIKEIREGLTEYLRELGLNVKEVKRLATGIYRIEIGNEVKIDIEKFSRLRELLQQFGMYYDTSSSDYCSIDPLFLFDIYGVGQISYVTDGPWYARSVYVIIRYLSFVEPDDELLNRIKESSDRISSADEALKSIIDIRSALDEKRKYVIKEVYVSVRDIPLCDE